MRDIPDFNLSIIEGFLSNFDALEKAIFAVQNKIGMEQTSIVLLLGDKMVCFHKTANKSTAILFPQENSGNHSGFKGSGLGMAITKKLVDLMNGTIHVESEQGVGSKFIVEVAFDIGMILDFSKTQKEKEERRNQEIHLKGRKILLVDDQSLNIEITKSMLEDIGIDVMIAENGQAAVNIFNNCADGTFDAVIMDVRMPVMDGLSATKKIRALPKNDASSIPIIAMTADTYEEDIRKAIEAGMNAYLTKPISQEELILTLSNFYLEKKS